jgi:hypothetical protein
MPMANAVAAAQASGAVQRKEGGNDADHADRLQARAGQGDHSMFRPT